VHVVSRSGDASTCCADNGTCLHNTGAASTAAGGCASNSCTTSSSSSSRSAAMGASPLRACATATIAIVGRDKGIGAKRGQGKPDARTPAQRLQGALHKLNKERRKVAAALKGLLSAA
jgi:hypothetical protein